MKLLTILAALACAGALFAQGTTSLSAHPSPPPAGVVNAGTANNAVLAFNLIRVQPNPPPVSLTGVSATFNGTATALDITGWTLIVDSNGNGVLDVGVDQQQGGISTALSPDFQGLSVQIPSPITLSFWILVELTASATPGSTVSLELANTGITTSGGGKNGGPVSSSTMTIANSGAPDIDVSRNSVPVASGGGDVLGSVLTSGASFTWDIANTGAVNLLLSGTPIVSVGNEINCTFVVTQPGTNVLGPTGSTPFSVAVTPLSAAPFSFDVSIDNTDPDSSESPYTFAVSGLGASPTAVALFVNISPGGGTGGLPFGTQPQVEARNGVGNVDTTFNGLVTAGITASTGTAGAALLGTISVAAANGVADFTDLAIDLAGTGYQLTFTSSGLSAADSSAFDITVGVAARLGVITQPGNGTGGLALSQQPAVAVQDAGGNTISGDNSTQVTAAIRFGTGSGGANLLGTLMLTVSSGQVGYTDLAIDLAATGYEFEFTASGLSSGTSSPFDISVGPAAQLAVASNPGNGTGGVALLLQPVVEVQDAGGNTVTSDNSTQITAAISAGPGAANLLGTALNTVSAGATTYADLAIDLAGTGYQLEFTATGLSPVVSAAFDIAIGPAAALQISTQPGNGGAGGQLAVQPVVQVVDAGGNTLTGDSTTQVTATLIGGPGSLSGTDTETASAGVVQFVDLGVTLAGTGYQLEFSAGTLPAVTSGTFDVGAGVAAQVSVVGQPGNGTGGLALSAQPVIEIQDAGGALLSGDNTTVVTAALIGGTSGAALLGTVTATAAGGIATFTDLAVDLAGTGYQLVFTSGSLAPDTSATFDIVVGNVFALRVALQPAGAVTGAAFTTQPQVEVIDAGGNRVTSDNTTEVTAAIAVAHSGAILSGTAQVTVSGGLATFTDLSVAPAGGPVTLAFADTGSLLVPVNSDPFTVNTSGSGSGSGGKKKKGSDDSGCSTSGEESWLLVAILALLAAPVMRRRRA